MIVDDTPEKKIGRILRDLERNGLIRLAGAYYVPTEQLLGGLKVVKFNAEMKGEKMDLTDAFILILLNHYERLEAEVIERVVMCVNLQNFEEW